VRRLEHAPASWIAITGGRTRTDEGTIRVSEQLTPLQLPLLAGCMSTAHAVAWTRSTAVLLPRYRSAVQAKRHHYVSQFYLAHWTHDATKTGKLVVTDVDSAMQRPGTPKGEANVKDLYTIDDVSDPLIVENEFSKIEGHIAPLIQRIEKTEALPADPNEMDSLLYWVALQRQKVLRMRGVHEDFYDQLGRTMMKVLTKDDATFQQAKRALENDGESMAGVSRKELAETIPRVKFRIDATTLVQHMLDGAATIAETLMKRSWTLWAAPKGVPYFITSDNPVCLVPMREQLFGMPLGFAMPGTCVLYALTPRLAIAGAFETQPSRSEADYDRVRSFNSMVLQSAERFVYSCRPRIYHRAGNDVRWTYTPRVAWPRSGRCETGDHDPRDVHEW
jgi:hypothetical protein